MNIISKHDKILVELLKLHKRDSDLLFVPRKRNNKNRLADGFWFIGNEKYLQVSFWKGTDWKEKVHNISFAVFPDGTSRMHFSAQDSKKKAKFLRSLGDMIGGFEKYNKKDKWHYDYSGTDYISNLKKFLKIHKPVIDEAIRKHAPDGISLLDAEFYHKYIDRVIKLRDEQRKYGSTNKVVRVCWNTEGWRFPSGSKGKSSDKDSYEAMYGYGHEEWLFDKSRIIDGHHYSFLEPLNVESGKHHNRVYNISLFTINCDQRKFYVGKIEQAECIADAEAKKVFAIYKKKGWIEDKVEDIRRAGADPSVFLKNDPEFIFNLKFKFENATILPEMEEIAPNDINITTSRMKLLPQKTDFDIQKITVAETEGDDRSETTRKVVYKKEVEYDPLHSKMQNAIRKLLKKQYKKEYQWVGIEKSRVDIMAKTHDDKYHYFEVKTNAPKLCIRLAIGQIMEYAYWADAERAEKLIIVGDTVPDEEAKKYLQHIRSKFEIPVYFRCIDLDKNTLSEDF